MSFLAESSKDGVPQDTDALDHNLGRVEAEGRLGPVAGWFVPKPSQSRNYNEGKVIRLHLVPYMAFL
jgi:hypothetical protein